MPFRDTSEMTGTYMVYLWVSVAVVILLCLLLWWGWRGRKKRQQQIAEPAELPSEILQREPRESAEGMIIGTVAGDDSLQRIAVHELGLRHHGRIELHPEGVAVFRSGVRNYLIPADTLTHIRTDRGIVGKFVEKDGAIIIGWRLGDLDVETGFRPRHAEEGQRLLTALKGELKTS